ncbi:unnamed protein product [Prorocentrum cordatum]|uniref:Uncharacterized protein n=1 Tax=Prorocentrum cordatum TaxID=2364126 RepID=A0ABN9VP30_9DINO|nr:unnamed protein product [Polarella glacialis]
MIPTPQAIVYATRQPTDRHVRYFDAAELRTLSKVCPQLYNKAEVALTRWLVWDPPSGLASCVPTSGGLRSTAPTKSVTFGSSRMGNWCSIPPWLVRADSDCSA